ncbi:hypothetical protein VD0001_g6219 [Verticillium dahliae]|nr:hypothetical protein VD0001_g6219 [Verticillium dahliae]
MAPDESASRAGSWSSEVASLTVSKAPCNSTTRAGPWTSCTSRPLWANSTSSTSFTTVASSPGLASFDSSGSVPETIETSTLVPTFDLTTFTTSTMSSEDPDPPQGTPTTTETDEPLPSSPNYPWGGLGPLHRHQNVTSVGRGQESELEDEAAVASVVARGAWWSRWRTHLDRLQSRWRKT